MEIRLLPDVRPAHVLEALQQLGMGLQNVLNSSHILDEYFRWVDTAHRQLAGLLVPAQVEGLVESPRYWALLQLRDKDPARLYQLITREAEATQRVFAEMATELETLHRRWLRHIGLIVVPDTNVFLHHPRTFDYVCWPEAAGTGSIVHLVVPLVVINELDRHKRTNNKTRARETLRRLNDYLPQPDATVDLPTREEGRQPTTLEVLVDPLDHVRLPDADSEIVDRALYVAELSGRQVAVATLDTGMRLLAKTHHLDTVDLTDGQ